MKKITGSNIEEIEHEIISEFDMFDDPMDKYAYIIDLGNEMPPFKEEYRTDELLVKGCQSKVWLHAGLNDNRIRFMADSNTAITKGIVALLIRVLNNQHPDDVVNARLDFIDKIGLRSHLSSQRSNGLTAMIKQMKMYAAALKRVSEG